MGNYRKGMMDSFVQVYSFTGLDYWTVLQLDWNNELAYFWFLSNFQGNIFGLVIFITSASFQLHALFKMPLASCKNHCNHIPCSTIVRNTLKVTQEGSHCSTLTYCWIPKALSQLKATLECVTCQSSSSVQ